jgi:hypothetical protein
MKCMACDDILTDKEATRKVINPEAVGENRFVDLCNKCFHTIRDMVNTDDNDSEQAIVFELEEGE